MWEKAREDEGNALPRPVPAAAAATAGLRADGSRAGVGREEPAGANDSQARLVVGSFRLVPRERRSRESRGRSSGRGGGEIITGV